MTKVAVAGREASFQRPELHWLMRRVATLLVACAAFDAAAEAQQVVDGMIVPNGQVITGPVFSRDIQQFMTIRTGADANRFIDSVPPTQSFTNNLPATVVLTSVPTLYVRAYTLDVTRPVGGFIAASNSIRGLTPQQVRDVLALPYLPDSLTLVNVPAGTCVLFGNAAPITGTFAPKGPPHAIPTPGPWGNGGVLQVSLIGPTSDPTCQNAAFLPQENFFNRQLIQGNALAYRPNAGVGNTYAVAAALDVGAFPAQFSDMDNIYNALDILNYGSPAGLQAALKQLDGESYADFGFMRMQSARVFLDVMHQQMRGTRARRAPPAASGIAETAEAPLNLTEPAPLVSDLADGLKRQMAAGGQRRTESGGVWFAPYGSAGAVYGDSTTHSTTYGLHGFAVGGDLTVADNFLLGLSLSYSSNAFSTSIPSNYGTNEAVSVAGYASYAPDPWYIDAAFGYAYNWSSLTRTIVFPGVFRTAQGNPSANQILGSVESGVAFPLNPHTALTPFGRFEVTTSTQNAFAETGAGAISLTAAAQTTTGVRTILGLQLSGSTTVVEPQDLWLAVRAGWAHDYADLSGALTANFLGKPDTSFTVIGPTPDRNAVAIGATLNLALRLGQAFVSYDGNLAQSYSTHSGMVGLRMNF
ncbi:MAG: autotransporter outer membrane beta-barrel domain-containing protein [Reyranellaceae bacterium]